MKSLQLLFQSSLGRKFIMAATGAALVLFVLGHLLGNLQIFLPREHINAYGHFLHEKQGLLWVVRLGLLTLVGLHIWSALALTDRNRAAHPADYAVGTPLAASWTSRYMLLTGIVIAAFAVYHLLHFTLQVRSINLAGEDFSSLVVQGGPQKGYHDVYQMMVLGFSQPVVSLFYLVAVGFLCLHLSHGMSAMFQSLGLEEGAWRHRVELGSKALAAAIFAGYASIPIAVFLRIVQ